MCLMILLCDMRYGYLINWFLSCKPFLLISKLSFGMYLVHLNTLGLMFPKHVVNPDGYVLFWEFLSFFTATAIVSVRVNWPSVVLRVFF